MCGDASVFRPCGTKFCYIQMIFPKVFLISQYITSLCSPTIFLILLIFLSPYPFSVLQTGKFLMKFSVPHKYSSGQSSLSAWVISSKCMLIPQAKLYRKTIRMSFRDHPNTTYKQLCPSTQWNRWCACISKRLNIF